MKRAAIMSLSPPAEGGPAVAGAASTPPLSAFRCVAVVLAAVCGHYRRHKSLSALRRGRGRPFFPRWLPASGGGLEAASWERLISLSALLCVPKPQCRGGGGGARAPANAPAASPRVLLCRVAIWLRRRSPGPDAEGSASLLSSLPSSLLSSFCLPAPPLRRASVAETLFFNLEQKFPWRQAQIPPRRRLRLSPTSRSPTTLNAAFVLLFEC